MFIENGHEVVVVDDLSTGRRSNINPGATFYQVDIRSPQLAEIIEKEKPQVVDHHAAQIDVRHSVEDPLFDADVNVLGSIKLIELARKFNLERFIYISTGGAVYGEPEYLPCDEAHPINPICPYGASKHTVEHYLYMYHELYDLDYVVLRYPNVYGPRQDPHGEAGVVAIFSGQMLRGDPVVINGDGEQERDFVYVRDCARANMLALTTENSNTIFNLGYGKGITINEVFKHIKNFAGYELSAKHGPAKVGETRRIFLEASKAEKELDWHPTVGLEAGLSETVEYFRQTET
jgi:UDP-glucose 4-epimerase